MCVVRVVCCQVEVSATARSLVQSSSAECDMSNDCDPDTPLGEAMTRNRLGLPRGWGVGGGNKFSSYLHGVFLCPKEVCCCWSGFGVMTPFGSRLCGQ